MPLGSAGVAEHDHRQHDHDRDRAEPELREQRAPVDARAVRADDLRDAEDEQQVRDDASRRASRARPAAGRSFTARSAMISSGALPKLAFRNPPMPGPGVLRRMLGRLADQPGERDERSAREHEHQRLVGVRRVVDADRDGREGEERPEDPAGQSAGSVPSGARGGPVRLGRHAHAAGRPSPTCSRPGTPPASPRSAASPRPASTERFRDVYLASFFEPGHRSRRSSTRRRSRRLLGEFGHRGRRRRARPLPRGRARGRGGRRASSRRRRTPCSSRCASAG